MRGVPDLRIMYVSHQWQKPQEGSGSGHCLHRQLRLSEDGGNTPETQVPRGQAGIQAFLRTAVSALLCSLFPAHFHLACLCHGVTATRKEQGAEGQPLR